MTWILIAFLAAALVQFLILIICLCNAIQDGEWLPAFLAGAYMVVLALIALAVMMNLPKLKALWEMIG